MASYEVRMARSAERELGSLSKSLVGILWPKIKAVHLTGYENAPSGCHCEERSDVAIWVGRGRVPHPDCFAFRLRSEWSRNDNVVRVCSGGVTVLRWLFRYGTNDQH